MENLENLGEEPAKGPAKKLGLSKVVYGLGLSARDALIAGIAATVVSFPVMYKLQGKNAVVDAVAKVPERLHGLWKKGFKDNSGKAGAALGASFGIATVVSYIAHVPGLIRGPMKVRKAEDLYNDAVDDNERQALEIKKLSETVTRQGKEITEVKAQNAALSQGVTGQEAAACDPQDSPEGAFAGRCGKEAGASKAEQLLAQKAATEKTAANAL